MEFIKSKHIQWNHNIEKFKKLKFVECNMSL